MASGNRGRVEPERACPADRHPSRPALPQTGQGPCIPPGVRVERLLRDPKSGVVLGTEPLGMLAPDGEAGRYGREVLPALRCDQHRRRPILAYEAERDAEPRGAGPGPIGDSASLPAATGWLDSARDWPDVASRAPEPEGGTWPFWSWLWLCSFIWGVLTAWAILTRWWGS